ncbi:hypothetical protein WA026_002565 [Henosepilachna vigintioctopunctata]|uniref:Reverse transcriptase n=1 Tax=Henosepilachna vigintioctopunctata TaxID=420089 RepID=A0AAW1U0Q8_9CUCU
MFPRLQQNALWATRGLELSIGVACNILKDLVAWCIKNRLILNMAKTECVVLFCDRSSAEIPGEINTQVSVANSTRFLGVHLDKDLKWAQHLANLTSELNSAIHSVSVFKGRVDFQTVQILFF